MKGQNCKWTAPNLKEISNSVSVSSTHLSYTLCLWIDTRPDASYLHKLSRICCSLRCWLWKFLRKGLTNTLIVFVIVLIWHNYWFLIWLCLEGDWCGFVFMDGWKMDHSTCDSHPSARSRSQKSSFQERVCSQSYHREQEQLLSTFLLFKQSAFISPAALLIVYWQKWVIMKFRFFFNERTIFICTWKSYFSVILSRVHCWRFYMGELDISVFFICIWTYLFVIVRESGLSILIADW